jgi:antitoxin VapB
MPISIKNAETEAVARKLSELTGETITEAVRTSVTERYERIKRSQNGRSLADDLNAIAEHYASLPIICDLSDDELLGYDEIGAPTR